MKNLSATLLFPQTVFSKTHPAKLAHSLCAQAALVSLMVTLIMNSLPSWISNWSQKYFWYLQKNLLFCKWRNGSSSSLLEIREFYLPHSAHGWLNWQRCWGFPWKCRERRGEKRLLEQHPQWSDRAEEFRGHSGMFSSHPKHSYF